MKILHTSDRHLGQSLFGRKRYEKFSAFFDWLVQTFEDEKVDALLVAGNIFNTSYAQQPDTGALFASSDGLRHPVLPVMLSPVVAV